MVQCWAAIGVAAPQIAAGAIDILPAGLGKPRGVGGNPELLAHAVITRPGLIGHHQSNHSKGQIGTDSGNQRPVDISGHQAIDVPAIDRTSHGKGPPILILRAILTDHGIDDIPARVSRNHFGREAIGLERALEGFIKLLVVAVLIPATDVIDGKIVVALRPLDRGNVVVDHVLRPEALAGFNDWRPWCRSSLVLPRP